MRTPWLQECRSWVLPVGWLGQSSRVSSSVGSWDLWLEDFSVNQRRTSLVSSSWCRGCERCDTGFRASSEVSSVSLLPFSHCLRPRKHYRARWQRKKRKRRRRTQSVLRKSRSSRNRERRWHARRKCSSCFHKTRIFIWFVTNASSSHVFSTVVFFSSRNHQLLCQWFSRVRILFFLSSSSTPLRKEDSTLIRPILAGSIQASVQFRLCSIISSYSFFSFPLRYPSFSL